MLIFIYMPNEHTSDCKDLSYNIFCLFLLKSILLDLMLLYLMIFGFVSTSVNETFPVWDFLLHLRILVHIFDHASICTGMAPLLPQLPAPH